MLGRSVQEILMSIPGILIAMVISGFAQAYIADKLGDTTPRYQGKLSLNPKEHIDPFGFLIFVLVGFGWSKPVDINPRNFKNIRVDTALVSAAGFAANILMAVLFAIIIKILILANVFVILGDNVGGNLLKILNYCIRYNLIFFVLGILPIPPFPGSRILESLTNIERYEIYANLKRYSLFVFLILYATNILSTNILSIIITYPYYYIYLFILRIFGLPLM